MKRILLLGAVMTALALSARADVITFSSGFANGGLVPDYPASGWSDARTISAYSGWSLTDLNVMLNISGGYNGDLYGYLRYVPEGSSSIYFAQLLNRVGTGAGDEPQYTYGYATSGMHVWLDDEATANGSIHNVQNPADEGYYLPDGGLLSTFDGKSFNGSWTLFLADRSTGYESTVESWGLELTGVPEPGVWPVAAVIALVAGFQLMKYRRQRKMA